MRNKIMKKTFSYALIALATICVGVSLMRAQKTRAEKQSDAGAASRSQTCPDDDSGLKLPAGFCATVFADSIGHARHMVVASNGVLYVNTWSGRYYGNDTPRAGGFLVALQGKNDSGRADVMERFGSSARGGEIPLDGQKRQITETQLLSRRLGRIIATVFESKRNSGRDPQGKLYVWTGKRAESKSYMPTNLTGIRYRRRA